MGFLDSFKKLFQDDGSNSSEQQAVHCEELIRLISFAQKTKPLMGGNYGITVSYSSPNRAQNEYTGQFYAEFGFYDFNSITFAREAALKAGHSELDARMVHHYYDDISKTAGLTQNDWPYGMDAFDFARMLTNSDPYGFTALIPDKYSDDIYKIRIKAGITGENGIVAYRLVEKACLEKFPNLSIKKTIASVDQFHFTISI